MGPLLPISILALAASTMACSSKASVPTPTHVILTGGDHPNYTSVETIPASSCTPPPFPQGRVSHSLTILYDPPLLVACGGIDTPTSCIKWSKGEKSWWKYHTLRDDRYGHHGARMEDNTILILGGADRHRRSAETVPGGETFRLKHSGHGSCMIKMEESEDEDEHVVMIGGKPSHGYVDKYDLSGFLGSRPALLEAREDHACSAFSDSEDRMVLMVTGGYAHGQVISTTELLLPGARSWKAAAPLPLALGALRAAALPQEAGGLLCTGGYNDGAMDSSEVIQYLPDHDSWEQLGPMDYPRSYHAVVAGSLEAFCTQD